MAAAQTPRQAALRAWLFGCGYFILALSWIVEPFLVDIARHGWMAAFALGLMAGGLALFWAAAGGLAARWGDGPVARAMLFAVAITLAELARGYAFTGFPWALIGHFWIGTPVVQMAAFVGAPGLCLLTMAVGVAPVAFGAQRGAAAVLVVLALVWAGGATRLAQTPVWVADDAPVVRLLQPNAPQREKWQRDKVPEFFQQQLGLTADPAAPAPDVIVWPETSVAYRLDGAFGVGPEIARAAQGRPVVVGFNHRENGRIYNALGVLGADGGLDQIYTKHHLVPFGEYVPFGTLLARFNIFGLAAGGTGFSPGPGAQLVDLGPVGRVLPLICYEAIFPQDVRAAPERPQWILQITNDAWFGNFSGPYQHLDQARLRAVEMALPVLRAANTGVTAVIDAQGRVRASLPLNTAGQLTAALPPSGAETIYARAGDWPVLGFCLAVLAMLLGRGFPRRRR